MRTINIEQKLSTFTDHWDPRIAAELNGQHVKLAKLCGEFIWHKHDAEDEMFLVIKGEMEMHFRDKVEIVREMEFIVVPRGVEHKPVAVKEVHLMLFEPASTLNTGNVDNERTKKDLKWV